MSPNWAAWFPVNTDAWRDFCFQAERQPQVKNAFGLAVASYRKVSHPRELGEPWYVDPATKAREPQEAPSRPETLRDYDRRCQEDGPPCTQETQHRWIEEYRRKIQGR